MIIGLSGTLCSGKDTVAEYLTKQKGFKHISLSQILRELAAENGVENNMKELTAFGNGLNKKFEPGKLAKIALEKIDPRGDVVISSIRQPSEIEILKSIEGFKMIFVDADIEIRFKRLQNRGREGDSETLEEFAELEAHQSAGESGGMNLAECKKHSDYIIENNGSMEDYLNKIEETIKNIKGEK